MSDAQPTLLASAAVRELLQAALTRLEVHHQDDGDEAQRAQDHLEWDAALAAVRFCALQAAALGDPGLLPLVAESLRVFEHHDDDRESCASAVASALGALVEQEERPSAVTRRLASHKDADVRAALAAHLGVEDAAAVQLLERLVDDPEPRVRDAARRNLGQGKELPWWRGLFTSDPAKRLPPEELARLGPALKDVQDAMNGVWWEQHKDPRLIKALEALPDVLALELGERMLRREYYRDGLSEPTLVCLLPRPGVVPVLDRLARYWADRQEFMLPDSLFKAVTPRVPAELRHRLARELVAAAVACPWADRKELRGAGANLAVMAQHFWPAEADPAPVLEAVLGLVQPAQEEGDAYHRDWVAQKLQEILHASTADLSALFPRVLEARVAGYPGRWKELGYTMDHWLQRAPAAAVRTAAEQGIRSAQTSVVEWAAGQLLGPVFDEARDGPPLALLERLLEIPGVRRVVVERHSLRTYAVARLRRELRAGLLAFPEADAALSAIDTLWGGCARAAAFGRPREDSEDTHHAEARASRARFLGPPELHGPVTDQEWERYREARRAVPLGDQHQWGWLLRHVPAGPWHPEDRALLDQALVLARDQQRHLVIAIGLALSTHPGPEAEPIWDELERLAAGDDLGWIRHARQQVREAAGTTTPRKRRRAKEKPAARRDRGEWMDGEDP